MIKLNSFGTTNSKKIRELEKKLKIELPIDYKKFLEANNGGTTDGDITCFSAKGINEDIALDTLFGIGLEEDLDIMDWCDEYSDDLLEEMIIIGHAIETGMILLVNQADWKGIYFWDDSLYYDGSTEEECIYKISDCFEEFMVSLKEE